MQQSSPPTLHIEQPRQPARMSAIVALIAAASMVMCGWFSARAPVDLDGTGEDFDTTLFWIFSSLAIPPFVGAVSLASWRVIVSGDSHHVSVDRRALGWSRRKTLRRDITGRIEVEAELRFTGEKTWEYWRILYLQGRERLPLLILREQAEALDEAERIARDLDVPHVIRDSGRKCVHRPTRRRT